MGLFLFLTTGCAQDCDDPPSIVFRYDAGTRNTPFDKGLTEGVSEGVIINDMTDNGGAQIAIPCGEANAFFRSKGGAWGDWRELPTGYASQKNLGGFRIGAGVSVDEEGKLNLDPSTMTPEQIEDFKKLLLG